MRRLAAGVIGTAVATAAGVVLLTAALFIGVLGGTDDQPSAPRADTCRVAVTGSGADVALDTDQLTNAQTIVTVGRQLGVPAYGQVIAIAAAEQESSLRNLTHGDRDSLGLFQQRPSAGWGTASQILDPANAARAFYDRLMTIPGWGNLDVTDAAQQVQRSAFPLAYARWEGAATALVQHLTGHQAVPACGSTITQPLPAGAVGDMLRAAIQQVGAPYVWGATGPDAFDCSGLVVYAWRQAGYHLTARTTAQLYAASTPVPPGKEQPGDLVFTEFGRDGTPAHVMIVIQPGLAVEAAHTGSFILITHYTTGVGILQGRLVAPGR